MGNTPASTTHDHNAARRRALAHAKPRVVRRMTKAKLADRATEAFTCFLHGQDARKCGASSVCTMVDSGCVSTKPLFAFVKEMEALCDLHKEGRVPHGLRRLFRHMRDALQVPPAASDHAQCVALLDRLKGLQRRVNKVLRTLGVADVSALVQGDAVLAQAAKMLVDNADMDEVRALLKHHLRAPFRRRSRAGGAEGKERRALRALLVVATLLGVVMLAATPAAASSDVAIPLSTNMAAAVQHMMSQSDGMLAAAAAAVAATSRAVTVDAQHAKDLLAERRREVPLWSAPTEMLADTIPSFASGDEFKRSSSVDEDAASSAEWEEIGDGNDQLIAPAVPRAANLPKLTYPQRVLARALPRPTAPARDVDLPDASRAWVDALREAEASGTLREVDIGGTSRLVRTVTQDGSDGFVTEQVMGILTVTTASSAAREVAAMNLFRALGLTMPQVLTRVEGGVAKVLMEPTAASDFLADRDEAVKTSSFFRDSANAVRVVTTSDSAQLIELVDAAAGFSRVVRMFPPNARFTNGFRQITPVNNQHMWSSHGFADNPSNARRYATYIKPSVRARLAKLLHRNGTPTVELTTAIQPLTEAERDLFVWRLRTMVGWMAQGADTVQMVQAIMNNPLMDEPEAYLRMVEQRDEVSTKGDTAAHWRHEWEEGGGYHQARHQDRVASRSTASVSLRAAQRDLRAARRGVERSRRGWTSGEPWV